MRLVYLLLLCLFVWCAYECTKMAMVDMTLSCLGVVTFGLAALLAAYKAFRGTHLQE